jgi:hypothetical protein
MSGNAEMEVGPRFGATSDQTDTANSDVTWNLLSTRLIHAA